ncbi:MAG: DUF4012 domain-containing protein [Chloroflexota bacterium]
MSADRAAAATPVRRPWSRRRRALGGIAIAVLLLLVALAALAVVRYLPAVDEARALRDDLEAMVDRVQEAGFDIDRATVDALDADLRAARTRFDHLEDLVAHDPLVALARVLPPTAANVEGADRLVEAGGHLLDAVGEGLAIGRDFVEVRETAGPDAGADSALARLVGLMVRSRDGAASAAGSIAEARRALAATPGGLIGPLASMRDAMTTRVERYAPLLDTYLAASERVPSILGWDGPRRYLILTQDPAELRPTGGFIGSYGTISFDHGAITDHRFQDVTVLDVPWDYPRIEPPQELSDYLLGPRQPWQFADANWSPDFPTSARDALRLYTNESGDDAIDGVFAITTYTIDELLKATGPVDVPDYDATISSGDTTLKVLQLTRSAPPGEDRKAFLSAFADRLFTALFTLPPDSWGELLASADRMRDSRLLLAWFADPADQAFAVEAGVDGAVRQDPGDYLFPVEANVTPATKLSAWTSRSLDLEVRLDDVGNARSTLDVTWTNEVETPAGATFRAMDNVGGRILGMYFRLLVPDRSRVEEVTGGTLAPVTGPAVVAEEAGRLVIGTYLKIPAGSTALRCVWTSPYAADVEAGVGVYRLTIQRQPGTLAGPIRVTIRVPDGARITAASAELRVDGATATLETELDSDIVVGLQYGP